MTSLPDDYFVGLQQFTKNVYRDQYPSIDPSSPALSQAGKVVIITGASRGIGAEGFVPAFAKAGPKAIVLVARDAEKLAKVEATVKEINPNVETLSVPTDVASVESVKALYEKVAKAYGHADVLVHNAGVLTAEGPLKDADPSEWWKNFEINGFGAFLVAQNFVKALPDGSHGTFINIVTGGAYGVFPGMSGYGISKTVGLQLAAYVAEENPNVKTFAVHPGIIITDMTTDFFRPFAKDTPQLSAGLAVWLSTDKASFLSGRYISANWSVDELWDRREEITKGGKLKLDLEGTFGVEQFQS